MTGRIEISKKFSRKIISKLVSGIHVKTIISAVGIISFIHLVDRVPVKEEKIASNIEFGINMKITKNISADIFFNSNVLTGCNCNISVNSITHLY